MSRFRFRRALGAGLVALAAATYSLAVAAPPATALTNVVAVAGSDTTQDLVQAIITNDGLSATNVKAGNFQATPLTVPADDFCNGVTYHLKQGNAGIGVGETPAPDGSGEGRDALRFSVGKTAGPPGPDSSAYTGIANATGGCVDIARSSGGRRADCSGANSVTSNCDPTTFEYYAYAIDGVTWATTSPNAPASLTQAQIQQIYTCAITDWSAVGGTPGHITRVLPQNGSGTLSFFLSNILGVSSISALNAPGSTGQTTGCTPIIQQQENQSTDLLNGNNLSGTNAPFSNNAYAEAIMPYSSGKWSFQAGNSLDPTVDNRGGARPGQLIVQQGSVASAPVSMVRWTGTSWSLNDASVVGNASGSRSINITSYATRSLNLASTTRTIASLGTTTNSRAVTDPGGSFVASGNNSDVGATISGAGIPVGSTITAVASTTSATISQPATATASVSAIVGSVVVTDAGATNSFATLADAGAKLTGNGNLTSGATIATVIDPNTVRLSVGATAAGTAATTIDNRTKITVTGSGSDAFTAGDVGAALSVNGNLTGLTIKSVSSPTVATLSAPAIGAGSAVATTATFTGQVTNYTGGSTATSPTVTGNFQNSDIGKTIDGPGLFPGTKITAVSVGVNATVSPAAKFTIASQAFAVGFTAVSQGNVNATSGAFAPYPGARFVYNVIDSTSPLYTTVRGMVGFDDVPGGAKSALCNGGDNSTIKTNGFIPLASQNGGVGGNTNVTCVKK